MRPGSVSVVLALMVVVTCSVSVCVVVDIAAMLVRRLGCDETRCQR